ncbi:MAG TPA: hypothetical protein VE033_02705 [Acetobacteraceae bacterium]|jgi:hypothetical protein|nr:hypothetical protein [Acetobacteraceae bacterium]
MQTATQTATKRTSRPATDLVAASLLTSEKGAELHLVSRDGRLLRLQADESTARDAAVMLWQALNRSR